MTKDGQDERKVFAGALPLSLIAHAAAILLLIFGLPVSLFEPAKDEVINVDLVPPEPPAEDQAEPEPPPPEPSDTTEEKLAAEPVEAAPRPDNVIQPVVRFGDKDAGPRIAPEGDGAEEKAAATDQQQPDKQQEAPAAPLTVDTAASGPTSGAPEELPAVAPVAPIKPETPLELDEATTLFSLAETGDPLATSAMANLPRSARAAHLCATQLRDQLRNGMPPYYPDLVPSYPLLEGAVMEVPDAAFRASRRWFELAFRCEIDADATRVVAFAFRVGAAIPRSEWEGRKLPAD